MPELSSIRPYPPLLPKTRIEEKMTNTELIVPGEKTWRAF
jgi:hypothetical protein